MNTLYMNDFFSDLGIDLHSFGELNSTGIFLVSVLGACLVIQLIYYWGFLARPRRYARGVRKGQISPGTAQPPVSVIVCAKNEAQSLRDNLPILLEQNYPIYEVIFVDDESNDETSEVIAVLATHYPHLYHTYVPEGSISLSHRKLGLTLGVKAAKYDTLLLTDANCVPTGSDWIANMVRHVEQPDSVVLGFSALNNPSSQYAAYDYFFSNIKMAASALIGRSYMANGKNLVYSKERFLQQRGFSNANSAVLEAGEDDLFVDVIARPDNLFVELAPESMMHVTLNENQTWTDIKSYRVATSSHYKLFPSIFWRLEKWTRLVFYLSLIASIMWLFPRWEWLSVVGLAYLLRLFTQLLVINRTATALGLPGFYLSLPLFDIMQMFVDEYFSFAHRLTRKKNYR
ncbi:glycosyl transferase family 2 [Bacteroidia bacterium]|nr:glycosyl transferase family 2 [Bacteroidia bacterium]